MGSAHGRGIDSVTAMMTLSQITLSDSSLRTVNKRGEIRSMSNVFELTRELVSLLQKVSRPLLDSNNQATEKFCNVQKRQVIKPRRPMHIRKSCFIRSMYITSLVHLLHSIYRHRNAKICAGRVKRIAKRCQTVFDRVTFDYLQMRCIEHRKRLKTKLVAVGKYYALKELRGQLMNEKKSIRGWQRDMIKVTDYGLDQAQTTYQRGPTRKNKVNPF